MERGRLIAKFEVPQYIREIEVSKKQRPKYYYWNGVTIKAKGKKLLQKYIDSRFKEDIIRNNGEIIPTWLKSPYCIAEVKGKKVIKIFNTWDVLDTKVLSSFSLYPRTLNIKLTEKQRKSESEFILINLETKERVVANSTQAGKPKRIIIKGQDMYSGVLNEFTRAKIVNELKADYNNKVWQQDIHIAKVNLEYFNFPVIIEMELIDTIKDFYDNTKEGDGTRWDVGNRAYPYMKTFVDFLVENNVIPDDDRLHVEGEGYFFTPCNEYEDRKLIFRIYKVD